jgi:zinc transporter 1/2/3
MLMGVSAGTFIFIASSEIIVEEFAVSRNKYWKFLFYLMGIALMSSVYFIEKATGGDD